MLIGMMGCKPDNKETTQPGTPSISPKDRPALRIVAIDVGFVSELEVRWKSFSEQPITIESIGSEQLSGRATDSSDVLIYPGRLLGDLVQLDWIIPLPSAAAGKLYETGAESTVGTGIVSELWPARWRSVSRFGGKTWALPLGAPQLAILSRKISLEPLTKLDSDIGTTQDRTNLAAIAWKELLLATRNSEEATANFQSSLSSLSDKQKDALVDRFLFIASTTNAKRRGLFDLTNLQSRLATPDFVLAADILAQLCERFPDVMLAEHADGWNRVLQSESAAMTIGIASQKEAVGDIQNQIQIGTVVFNPAIGLLASVGKRTRQTAVASQLIAWLSDAEQRGAFSAVDPGVERWPGQPGGSSQDDNRLYKNLNNRDARVEPLNLTIRFAHERRYRNLLADALVGILRDPESSRGRLTECSQLWGRLTEEIGLVQQRPNIEQSMGFSQ